METLQISITMGAERGGAGLTWYFLMASVLPARRQTKVLSLAVVWMTPPPRLPCRLQSVTKIASYLTPLQLTGVLCRNSCGSPMAWPSQSITRDSSSVQAGELAQVKPRQLIPSASMSPRREG